MSLVGSLEDLSLGDILQIISLSQKSGVLSLQTEGGGGRIVFVQGLVRGAVVKSGPGDLRGVLVDGGFVAADDFDAAAQYAESEGGSVASAVAETTALSSERIDSLCREAVESAVVTMFTWRVGDFSFDVRSEPEPDDPELLLPTGINAQFLAMEAARMGDEGGRGAEQPAPAAADPDAAFDEMSAHEMFGVAAEDAAPTAPAPIEIVEMDEAAAPSWHASADRVAVDTLARAALELAAPDDETNAPPELDLGEADFVLDEGTTVELVDAHLEAEPLEGEMLDDSPSSDEPLLDALLLDAEPMPGVPDALELDCVADEVGPVDEQADLEEAGLGATEAREEPDDGPLVVIDPDLVALEWVKFALKDRYSPIHIFQGSEQGLARIRQYLVRGQPPLVLFSPAAQVDALSGIRDSGDFVSRLKAQSARISVLWLLQEGADDPRGRGADGTAIRPAHTQLRLGGATPEELQAMATAFEARVAAEVARTAVAPTSQSATPTPGGAVSPDVLKRLRDAVRALTEASSRGEVLPLVIRFAAETFSRVAMFMVRDGEAVGMAQHGLEACDGPGDEGIRAIRFPTARSDWMSAVMEHGKAAVGSLADAADREFVALLGSRAPSAAYLAPIESGGQVIALIYGDNLPGDEVIGNTSGLEVVMHHAGLALDRAALERALSESEAD